MFMASTLIQGTGIRKTYYLGRTELPVLKGVDLSVERGEFVSIIGSSGSGKSTLLHVLSGLEVPQRGQVYFEGRELFEPENQRRIPVKQEGRFLGAVARKVTVTETGSPQVIARGATSPADVRLLENRRNTLLNRSFGFVFQFYHLLPEYNVLENVILPEIVGQTIGNWLCNRGRAESRALSLLQRVGLEDRLKHRPNELSGGERQRVAIARALMNEPAVLFADEPTGNLDAKTGRGVFDLLKALNKSGQTLVMVTHDRELAAEADKLIHLVDGKVQ